MVLSVLLAAILDFLRDSWPGLRRLNSSKLKCYFEHESQVCVSAVHPDMMYNHDNWDLICYFGGNFVLQFWKGKTKNRAWHGADLESAYPNCVKTTAWQILLRNALQTLRMPLFEKWALTITSKIALADLKDSDVGRNPFYAKIHTREIKVYYSSVNGLRGEWFLPISQSILNQLSWNFTSTIFYWWGDYSENFTEKYTTV